jgi:hypothetical protein
MHGFTNVDISMSLSLKPYEHSLSCVIVTADVSTMEVGGAIVHRLQMTSAANKGDASEHGRTQQKVSKFL